MTLRLNTIHADELPETFLAAQLNYLRHYRALMRSRDVADNGTPCGHLWHWAVMLQPRDIGLVPEIQAGSLSEMPSWLQGKTLAVIEEETGNVIASAR